MDLTPESRLPNSILEDADKIGIRTLAVPEEYGGMPIDTEHEVRTFAIISEEIARGDSGLADKLVQKLESFSITKGARIKRSPRYVVW